MFTLSAAISKMGIASSTVSYRFANNLNQHLAEGNHPITDVPFDSDGFPFFESKYKMKLNPDDFLKTRQTHFNKASKYLYNKAIKDSDLAKKFTPKELESVKNGDVTKDYTWHTGGFSIWGSGN